METRVLRRNLVTMADDVPGLAVPTFLVKWRKHRRYTQEKLAEMVEASAPSISQLETGKQGFSDKSLAALAKALGCSPIALLAQDPSRPDSFWPLFEAAEKLEGVERRRLHKTLRAALDLDEA